MTAKRTKHIHFSGIMCSGKTTLTRKLANALPNSYLMTEDVGKNLFLKDFYEDMKKWGFHSRVSFLANKASLYGSLPKNSDYLIFDRGIFELMPYARLHFDLGNLSIKEFETYKSLYHTLTYFIPKPDVIIYLKCSVEEILLRIKTRSRNFELNANYKYIQDGIKYYDDWYNSIKIEDKYQYDTTDISLNDYGNMVNKIIKNIL